MIKCFLGIKISTHNGGYFLSQEHYVDKLLREFNLTHIK